MWVSTFHAFLSGYGKFLLLLLLFLKKYNKKEKNNSHNRILIIGIWGTITGERIKEFDDGQSSVSSDLSFVHSYPFVHSSFSSANMQAPGNLKWWKYQINFSLSQRVSIRIGTEHSEDTGKRVTNFCQGKNVILVCNIAQRTS